MSALVTLQQVRVCLLAHTSYVSCTLNLDLLTVECVFVCVGRQHKTGKLTICQQLLMNEEMSLVLKEGRHANGIDQLVGL